MKFQPSDHKLQTPLVVLGAVAQAVPVRQELRWLLGGEFASALYGVAPAAPPTQIELLATETAAEHLGDLLASAPGFATLDAPPGGERDALHGQRRAFAYDATMLELVAAPALVSAGQFAPLDLRAAWPLRGTANYEGLSIALLPLEYLALQSLLRGDEAQATAIAALMHQRGIAWPLLEPLLGMLPGLEEQVWEMMRRVAPRPRRAEKRRAIREAERREQFYMNYRPVRDEDEA